MQRFRLPLLLSLAVLALAGCGHTNKLAQYPIAGKRALYRTTISGSGSSWVSVQSPVKGTTGAVIAAVGSIIIGDQARRKLDKAANPDSIALAISGGIKNASADYLSLHPVSSLDENPELIVETDVKHYDIVSNSAGLAVSVEGNSRIIDRGTGIVVWENNETHVVPLSETWLAPLGGRIGSSAAGIFNAAKLFALSEEELREVLTRAGRIAGEDIGETLREDVAEMHEH